MKEHKYALLYTMGALWIACHYFDFVFDDSYDAFISNISAFQFTDFSMFDQHYLALLLVRDVMKATQELLPRINIFASFYILLNILSLLYTLVTLNKLVLKKQGIIIRHFFFIIVSLLFIENILSITHTRFATIFAGVALINLLYANGAYNKKLGHFALFLVGFLVRPESGIGAILIVSIAHLIFHTDIFSLARRFILPIISICMLIGIFYVHKHYTDRFEIQIEPDIEYALSTGRVISLGEMDTEMDSLRYEMATAGMFIDTGFVSLSFLKKITAKQFKFNLKQFKESAANTLFFYTYYPVFPACMIVFCFIALFTLKDSRLFLRLFIFLVFQFLLLAYLDYNVRIADRHFIGLHILFLLLTMYYVFKKRGRAQIPILQTIFFFLLISIGTGFSLENALGNQIQVYKDVECLQSAMMQIETLQKDKTVIVSQNTLHLFDKNYSFLNQNNEANNYLIYDISNYSIVPRNIAYLSKICACEASSAKAFLTWAANHRIVFLIDDERANLMAKYLYLTQGIPAAFVSVDGFNTLAKPSCLENSVYERYDLKYLIFD